jgi:choline dehydrogenase-like flavoprotein
LTGQVPRRRRTGITLSACVLTPRSRGQVALPSPDPTVKPFILHKCFADPEDLRAAIEGVRMAMRITATARSRRARPDARGGRRTRC